MRRAELLILIICLVALAMLLGMVVGSAPSSAAELPGAV